MRQDQTRSDYIGQDQIISDKIKLRPKLIPEHGLELTPLTRSDKIRQYQARSDNIRQDQTISDKIRQDQTISNKSD